jgi:hypothetical protein
MTHGIEFLHAYPMLTRDCATHIHTKRIGALLMKNPIDARIQQLQTLVKESSNLHINSALLDYSTHIHTKF